MTEFDSLSLCVHHELGHLELARVLGYPGWVYIERQSRNGAVWHAGRCGHADVSIAEHRRFIGLAGACAEALAYGDHSDGILTSVVRRISHNDAVYAGPFGRSHIDECLNLVRTLMPLIRQRAEQEISLFTQRAA